MDARIRWILSLGVMLLAPLAQAFAQDDPKFSLQAHIEPATAPPGATVQLVLEAESAVGWHAYGTLETTNIPVSFDVGALSTGGLTPKGEVQIPDGNPEPMPFGTQYPLDEIFQVTLDLVVPADASGTIKVAGQLGYQICKQGLCDLPKQAAFTATLTVDASAQNPASTKPGLTTKPGLKLEPETVASSSQGVSSSQGPLEPEYEPSEDEKAVVTARFEPADSRPGEVATLVLRVDVLDKWHAYGALETTNVPVSLDPFKQDGGDLEFEGDAHIPPGESEPTPVGPIFPLPHTFEVRQLVRVPAGAEAGEIELAGVLDYQVCDEAGCDPATEAEFDATLTVVAGEARAAYADAAAMGEAAAAAVLAAGTSEDGAAHGQGAGGGESGSADTSADAADAEDDPSNSWLELILLCIGGGLFALAMPCTYPMIPITFSFFMKQAEKRGGNVLPLSIVYGLGIIAMFVFVGVALSQVIIPFVNHWATNAVIGVFFFFFAFVLFGWVNLNPPQWMNKIAMKSQQSAGGQGGGMASALLGVFFMGATLVITSFTCTAPIVGSLIARVAELGTMRVAIGMAIFGATMAIPFMVLSLMPGKVKAMPKSGAWMDTLKISLGFVELAAAFKFVSMVDFAFGWQIMPRELFLMLWAAIFALWALFLFGILRKAGTPPEGATNGRMAMGMLVTLLAAYFMFGAMGNRLDPLMTSFAPSYSNAIVHAGAGGAGESKKHVIVYDDPDAAMKRARAEDKLLLYNFTGFN